MGFGLQLKLLLWKNFTLKKRAPVRAFSGKKNVNRFIAHLSFNEATARVLSHLIFFALLLLCSIVYRSDRSP